MKLKRNETYHIQSLIELSQSENQILVYDSKIHLYSYAKNSVFQAKFKFQISNLPLNLSFFAIFNHRWIFPSILNEIFL